MIDVGGHCYLFASQAYNYQQAKQFCLSQGLTLFKPKTENEIRNIAKFVMKHQKAECDEVNTLWIDMEDKQHGEDNHTIFITDHHHEHSLLR